jgi:hypothetical protein
MSPQLRGTYPTETRMDKESQYVANHARLMGAIEALKAAAAALPSPDDDYDWGHVGTMGHLASAAESILAD